MSCSILNLSVKDWLHEFSMSICAVLALASILAPILVLHGVHTGVIEQMRQRLMQDPAVLVVIPTGNKGAGFSEAFIDEIRSRNECEYAIGRTRDVAAELQITSQSGKNLVISLEATSDGDPMMLRNGITAFPHSENGNFEMIVTHEVARRLDLNPGDVVSTSLGRRMLSGKFERKALDIVVRDVLPAGAVSMTAGFVDLDFLVAIQNYRDGLSVGLFNVTGEDEPADRIFFESFRAYVRDLDSVESLEKWFKSQHVEVKTRSREIANIRKIDKTLSTIIIVISGTSCAGFFAFMMSTTHASVRRKWKMLGMLRLLGYSRFSMLMYPIIQALVTGILGVFLAFVLYTAVSYLIDSLFSAEGHNLEICFVPAVDFLIVFCVVQVIVVVSSLKVALKASVIDPSIVIRET